MTSSLCAARASILATLDEKGELDSLPFMPEMLQRCGQSFRVDKQAFKACDTINWTGLHHMPDAVHLADVRCDGSGHGGCQAGCLIYWKTAWLRRVEPGNVSFGGAADVDVKRPATAGIRSQLVAATRRGGSDLPQGRDVFACQATELMRAAPEVIPAWDVRQYVADVRSGNAGLFKVARILPVGFFNIYQRASVRFLPRWLLIRGGRTFPFLDGTLRTSPTAILDLQPGELVRVKSKEEIVKTLDVNNKNRGLSFDSEMVKYCGKAARVLRRVEQIIDERTGEMLHMKNPCIVLEGGTCAADYHRSCPRAIYSYWREIWLERIPE